MRRGRHYPSSIDRLPPEMREVLNTLRIDKGYTIDQIVDHMKGMDVALSRAAVGRHVKSLEDKVGEKIRELRLAAEAVSKRLDSADDAKVGALNRELAHAIIMRVATAQDAEGNDVTFDAQEAHFIAKALDHLARAEKSDAERILKIRKEVGRDVRGKIEQIAADATAEGDKPDGAAVLKRIREEVYGLFDLPAGK
jgi:hypothetical protein